LFGRQPVRANSMHMHIVTLVVVEPRLMLRKLREFEEIEYV
jgi:hypothetical protein